MTDHPDSTPNLDRLGTQTMQSSEMSSQNPIVVDGQPTYRLSKRRWAVLFAISLFGFTSSLTDEVGPILYTMLDLLELPLNKYIYIGQLFNYLAVVTTIPTAWLIDKYGIKYSMYALTVIMIIRNLSKALLFYPDLPYWGQLKIVYWAITKLTSVQILIAFYCTPLKISENWFPVSERSLAWTIMLSSYVIGLSVAAISLPRFIKKVSDVKPLFYLNIICAIITSIAVFTCITRSSPKDPPSERTIRSTAKPIPYFKSIKRMLREKDIVLHLLHLSIFEGVFYAYVAVLQDLLVASGHSKTFAGDVMAVNTIMAVIAIIALSTLVHRVKNTVLSCKLSSLMIAILSCAHLITMLLPLSNWVVFFVGILFTTSRGWSSPNFNNMNAQLASGIISEVTISGVSATMTVITVTAAQVGFVSLMESHSTQEKKDYTYSVIFASIVTLINAIIYMSFFSGKSSTSPEADEEQPVDATTDAPRSLEQETA